MPRMVLILGFTGVQSLDVTGPFEVFNTATLVLAAARSQAGYLDGYQVSLVGKDAQVSTGAGLSFVAEPLPDPDTVTVDTLLLPGGGGVEAACADERTVAWIRAVAQRARRTVSVCTGAFLAARAGLLDGCRATTHWAYADALAQQYPAIDVDPDPIFVRSTPAVWTAAGVTAGIDLALALVEDDHGTEVAQSVARWLVLHLRRPGGQTQFAAPVWMPRASTDPVRAAQEAIEAEPGARHSVTDLAVRAALSPRHFTRLFTAEIGETPGAYVERIRTEAARRQLEQTDDTVAAIADRCGFGSAESMRRQFIRRVGVAPDRYRRSFA